ncbi:hypothetical protein JYG23_01140 [Sedimentibacter sp. zth1]|uniref:hypothetical protein n=1 Tax=Sedimentibacter sp. zth1 TaxID=2816908 RepID=UPI001A90DD76|nr:hypothetical protein [Sedimentibacter sp. zth1]QSX06101.1 hypothetical protein JYG23_01140 [Sedimentibacter sp. zth1]
MSDENMQIKEISVSSQIDRQNFIGTIFENPKKGTMTVTRISKDAIYFISGKSTLSLSLNIIDETYKAFKRNLCSCNDLKRYKPDIYSSKEGGNDENCLFFFHVLNALNLINGDIGGKGKRKSPYFAHIK